MELSQDSFDVHFTNDDNMSSLEDQRTDSGQLFQANEEHQQEASKAKGILTIINKRKLAFKDTKKAVRNQTESKFESIEFVWGAQKSLFREYIKRDKKIEAAHVV